MSVDAGAMKPMQPARLRRLIQNQRWGCLGTRDENGWPYVSWVAYVAETDFSGLILHLSHLARHSRNLNAEPRITLSISEPDEGIGDPQQLARLTLNGSIGVIDRENTCYERFKTRYLTCLPDAEMMFQFADFSLYRFVPESGRYIEGFASSHNVDVKILRSLANV